MQTDNNSKITVTVPKTATRNEPIMISMRAAQESAEHIAAQVYRTKFVCSAIFDRPTEWVVVLEKFQAPLPRVRLRTRIVRKLLAPFRDVFCECRARLTWPAK